MSSPARFRSHARAAPGAGTRRLAIRLRLVLNERGPMDVEHAHQPKAPRGSSSSSRAFRALGSGRFDNHGVPGSTTVAARVPATPPQTHGARVSLSPSCPAVHEANSLLRLRCASTSLSEGCEAHAAGTARLICTYGGPPQAWSHGLRSCDSWARCAAAQLDRRAAEAQHQLEQRAQRGSLAQPLHAMLDLHARGDGHVSTNMNESARQILPGSSALAPHGC